MSPEAEAPSDERPIVPGRVALSDLTPELARLSPEQLAKRAPYLLLLGEFAPGEMGKTSAAFQTRNPDASPPANSAIARFAYELEKRPGANAFEHMVTLGRAKNNDLLLPDPAVSKFHASFVRGSDGVWSVTDASSNGTWLDGQKLEKGQPAVLRVGATINLANWVSLVYLPADALVAYLTTGQPPS
jgi:hypothetical protein